MQIYKCIQCPIFLRVTQYLPSKTFWFAVSAIYSSHSASVSVTECLRTDVFSAEQALNAWSHFGTIMFTNTHTDCCQLRKFLHHLMQFYDFGINAVATNNGVYAIINACAGILFIFMFKVFFVIFNGLNIILRQNEEAVYHNHLQRIFQCITPQ